jgi:hypothetical protein
MFNKKIINNMKTKKLLLAVLLMSFTAYFPARASVVLDSAHFPDAIFRAFISTWTGVAENSTIGDNVIASKKVLYCDGLGITNMQGVEYFTALTDLDCSKNQLTALDVTNNTNLTYLNCLQNWNIAALDVTHNTKLTTLVCDFNKITALDVTQDTLLTDLRFNYNQLTALDVTHNTKLTKLSFVTNKVTALDVTHNTLLTELNCCDNKIPTLDVSHNTALKLFNCGFNLLTSINVDVNTALTDFRCNDNQITSLNVTPHTALEILDCSNNKIPSLDVTHNIKLTMLNCDRNPFTSALDVTMDTALTILSCFQNKLSALDVTHNTKLTKLLCNENNLQALDVTHNTLLETLWCRVNKISTLDVTQCGNLVALISDMNKLTTLDLTHNANLETLWCGSETNLTKLDVTHNAKLKELLCDNNQLTTLDVSKNTLLRLLHFSKNHIAAIDLSSNNNMFEFKGTENGRKIKVYSYTRSAANGGGKGYYVPLTAQAATIIDTTHYAATKALAKLIDDAGQSGDSAFVDKIDTTSWKGATLGTLNNTKVLFLNVTAKKFTYNYKTGFTGSATTWTSDSSATAPYNNFYLTWDPGDIMTGIDGVENSDVNVYTTAGTINIGGNFNGKVNVFNLRGQQVYCGTGSEIAVPAGMYIVKVDGAVHKVLVK